MPAQIQFQPTLYIFLGTSSGQIGWRLKKLLHESYGKIPILRFLWIDLDSDITTEARPWFTRQERAELYGFNPATVVDSLDNHPTIKEWWPENTNIQPGMLVGEGSPKQMRLVGRLSLFRKFDDHDRGPSLYDKLETACESLFSIENIEKTKAMSTEQISYNVEEGCRIYLVFSPCGGTGSSIAFDIAYLCRHLLRGKSPKITSISMLPPVLDKALKQEMTSQREKIRANAYAWFKEDNYLAENPAWFVEYPGGVTIDIPAPPFNFRYLIDIENQVGHALNASEDVYKMIAQAIFIESCTSIAGEMSSAAHIVSVLGEPFQGIQRNYSSLVAASLQYPKTRLLEYCGTRLARDITDHGLLGEASSKEVSINTSALLSQLGLRDTELLPSLMESRYIKMQQEPIINKADSVAAALSLIDKQEAQNSGAQRSELDILKQQAETKLNHIQLELDREITKLTVLKGLNFSLSVLDKLLEAASEGAIGQHALSFDSLKNRITQQGVSDNELGVARQELEQDKKALKRLDDGPEDIIERKLRPKNWKKKFSLYKAECVGDMRDINDITIQLSAQQQAISIYERLSTQAGDLKRRILRSINTLERLISDFENNADDLILPHGVQSSGYEFFQEIDVDFPAYYKDHGENIDVTTIFSAMFPASIQGDFATLEEWMNEEIETAAPEYAKTFFFEDLESVSLLQALEELAEQRGIDPEELISQHFDKMLNYCHPFWRWDKDRGLSNMEGRSIIGVENENSPLIPAVYKNEELYSIKTTLVKDRIDILRVRHGLPAFLLRDMNEYKRWYEKKRKEGRDPLHVLPGVELAPDIVPDYAKRFREIFAVGKVFDYIIHVGEFFYYDPDQEYTKNGIEPKRAFRLAEDRSKAEEVFSRKESWARQTQESINSDIKKMGNNEDAIEMLEGAIQDLLNTIKQMKPDDPMRRQFENEVTYLRSMQRRLGKVV